MLIIFPDVLIGVLDMLQMLICPMGSDYRNRLRTSCRDQCRNRAIGCRPLSSPLVSLETYHVVPAITGDGETGFSFIYPLRESGFDYDHSLLFCHFCKERLRTVHPKNHERGTCDVVSLCCESTCQTRQAQVQRMHFVFAISFRARVICGA